MMATLIRPPVACVASTFDYSLLRAETALRVRASADRIREKVRRSLEDIIHIGMDLAKAKALLGHGMFGKWLRAEFGWSERTAVNFLSVAEQFGPKTEIIADLAIQPTAAYLLAAPSVPEKAREIAIRRAEAGERITTIVARQIVASTRQVQFEPRLQTLDQLLPRIFRILQRYSDRWEHHEVSRLAVRLRGFADTLETRVIQTVNGI
jgi:hypothetical protein